MYELKLIFNEPDALPGGDTELTILNHNVNLFFLPQMWSLVSLKMEMPWYQLGYAKLVLIYAQIQYGGYILVICV